MGLGLDMSNNNNNNPPTSRPKDSFASPALSLSLAGIFRHARAGAVEVEEGDEGSCGRRENNDQTAEISSENSGPVGSRSLDEDFDNELVDHDDDLDDLDEDDDGDNGKKKKKRKKYHRHTAEQIREMEA